MMRDELVANLTGQPPPEPPPIQDDGKAEKTKGCNYPARKKYAAAAKDQPEESGTLLLLSQDVIKPSDTENGPAASIRRIEFQADSNVLSEIGEAVKTAFEAYSAEECLEMLPPGRLKDRILSLTGQPGRKRTKLDHLNLEDTSWCIALCAVRVWGSVLRTNYWSTLLSIHLLSCEMIMTRSHTRGINAHLLSFNVEICTMSGMGL
jgi:hypothetical protein